jgi:hypothetical protein
VKIAQRLTNWLRDIGPSETCSSRLTGSSVVARRLSRNCLGTFGTPGSGIKQNANSIESISGVLNSSLGQRRSTVGTGTPLWLKSLNPK